MPNINIDKLQRPERALLISTAFIKVEDFSRMGFNALNGLSSFLRYAHDDEKYLMFQRPERALFISTWYKIFGRNGKYVGFNALNGLSSFLQKQKRNKMEVALLFQRPKRALFISTCSYLLCMVLGCVSTP